MHPAWSCGLLTKGLSSTARSPISSVSPWTSPDFDHRTPRTHARRGARVDELGARRRTKRRSVQGHLPRAGVHQALHSDPTVSIETRDERLKHVMSDAIEKRLIEALKSVDAHGDVAPAHVHDPMTMSLRGNAIQANLMRWDDVRGRYVLTGTGRRRTVEGSRAPGTVVSFRKRGIAGSGPLHRKSPNANLKE